MRTQHSCKTFFCLWIWRCSRVSHSNKSRVQNYCVWILLQGISAPNWQKFAFGKAYSYFSNCFTPWLWVQVLWTVGCGQSLMSHERRHVIQYTGDCCTYTCRSAPTQFLHQQKLMRQHVSSMLSPGSYLFWSPTVIQTSAMLPRQGGTSEPSKYSSNPAALPC